MTPMNDVVTLSGDTILDAAMVDKMYVFLAPPFSLLIQSSLTGIPTISLVSGYSRFPVHEPGNPEAFIGLLLIKKVRYVIVRFHTIMTESTYAQQLLVYDPSKALPVSAFPLSILPEARPSINCFQALDYL